MKIKNKTSSAIRINFKGTFYIFNPYEEKKINGNFDDIKFKDEKIKVDGIATKIKDCFEEIVEIINEEIKEKKIKKIKYKSEDKK